MDSSIALLGAIVGLLVVKWWRKSPFTTPDHTDESPPLSKDPYANIEPLIDFEWSTTTPIRLRPFKPKYHITMGLENTPLSNLIAMDNTYLDRIQLRRALIESHSASTVACNPIAEPAVLELYTWIFGTYLPRRFPRTFQLLPQSAHLHNVATNTNIPLRPASASTALRTLGSNVDTDFLLLLPAPLTTPGALPLYHLQAFVVCFPSGFSTCEKLGQSLSGIHAPVPGYKAKLAPSMDRFFARLEPGKAVMRANWTITTDDRLFCETGTHLRDEEPAGHAKTLDMHAPDVEADIARQRAEVVIADCRLRTERQTLHRLPETGAVVFAFKTYLHRLEEVKGEADGAGAALAEAIEGLTNGSVPEMNVYKRGVVWSETVLDYLRSEEG